MDKDSVVKYTGVGALLASVFSLVWFGMVPADQYLNLITGLFAGLGVYHASASSPSPTETKPNA